MFSTFFCHYLLCECFHFIFNKRFCILDDFPVTTYAVSFSEPKEQEVFDDTQVFSSIYYLLEISTSLN